VKKGQYGIDSLLLSKLAGFLSEKRAHFEAFCDPHAI
jgi:hypothetical protein